jgi:hypothetical protein
MTLGIFRREESLEGRRSAAERPCARPTPGEYSGLFASRARSHRQGALQQGDSQDTSGDTIPRRDASSAASARLEIFSLL